jgi:FixJ family two-component response regulator
MTGQIVIVEDDDGMRRALERLLKAAGYVTQSFASAEAVLLTQAAHHASCLVCDLRLPGLSGLDLRERLSARGALPPVVFMTGLDDDSAPNAARWAGALAVLRKPFDGQVLIGAVERACGRSGTTR